MDIFFEVLKSYHNLLKLKSNDQESTKAQRIIQKCENKSQKQYQTSGTKAASESPQILDQCKRKDQNPGEQSCIRNI